MPDRVFVPSRFSRLTAGSKAGETSRRRWFVGRRLDEVRSERARCPRGWHRAALVCTRGRSMRAGKPACRAGPARRLAGVPGRTRTAVDRVPLPRTPHKGAPRVMRIGLFYGGLPLEWDVAGQVEQVVLAEHEGFDACWFAHITGADALTVLALAGARTARIELGAAVVPILPRFPTALAQQALT